MMVEIIRTFFFDNPNPSKWVLTPTERIRTHKDSHCFFLEGSGVIIAGEELHMIQMDWITAARICPGNGALEIKAIGGFTAVIYADEN